MPRIINDLSYVDLQTILGNSYYSVSDGTYIYSSQNSNIIKAFRYTGGVLSEVGSVDVSPILGYSTIYIRKLLVCRAYDPQFYLVALLSKGIFVYSFDGATFTKTGYIEDGYGQNAAGAISGSDLYSKYQERDKWIKHSIDSQGVLTAVTDVYNSYTPADSLIVGSYLYSADSANSSITRQPIPALEPIVSVATFFGCDVIATNGDQLFVSGTYSRYLKIFDTALNLLNTIDLDVDTGITSTTTEQIMFLSSTEIMVVCYDASSGYSQQLLIYNYDTCSYSMTLAERFFLDNVSRVKNYLISPNKIFASWYDASGMKRAEVFEFSTVTLYVDLEKIASGTGTESDPMNASDFASAVPSATSDTNFYVLGEYDGSLGFEFSNYNNVDIIIDKWGPDPWRIRATDGCTAIVLGGTAWGPSTGTEVVVRNGILYGVDHLYVYNGGNRIYNCILKSDGLLFLSAGINIFDEISGCICIAPTMGFLPPGLYQGLTKDSIFAYGSLYSINTLNALNCAFTGPSYDFTGTWTGCQFSWTATTWPAWNAPKEDWNYSVLTAGIIVPPQPGNPPYTNYETFLWDQSRTGVGTGYLVPVTANFTVDRAGGYEPLFCNFTDLSVASGGRTLTDWDYDFGDGTHSSLQNPSHLYDRTGFFSPSLIATADDDSSGTITKLDYIEVRAIPDERYWVSNVDSTWSDTSNWSYESGSFSGASVPGAFNRVVYDTSGGGSCLIDATIHVSGLYMSSDYTGTVTQTGPITIDSSNATFLGGVFLGSSEIIINSDFFLNGSQFQAPDTLTVRGDFYHWVSSSDFTHNNGLVRLASENSSYSGGNIRAFDLEIFNDQTDSTGYRAISGTTYVEHSLSMTGGYFRANESAVMHVLQDASCFGAFGRMGQAKNMWLWVDNTTVTQNLYFETGGILPSVRVTKGTSNLLTRGTGPILINGDLVVSDGTWNTGRLAVHVSGGLGGSVPMTYVEQVLSRDPKYYWRCDDVDDLSSTFKDYMGNMNGTYNTTFGWTPPTVFLCFLRGLTPPALEIDDNAYFGMKSHIIWSGPQPATGFCQINQINCGDPQPTPYGDIKTFELWFKIPNDPIILNYTNSFRLLSCIPGAIKVWAYPNKSMEIGLWYDNGTHAGTTINNVYDFDQWNHITVSFDNTIGRVVFTVNSSIVWDDLDPTRIGRIVGCTYVPSPFYIAAVDNFGLVSDLQTWLYMDEIAFYKTFWYPGS